MSWFYFALLAATLYSGAIIGDKLILTKYFSKVSEFSLTTAAALSGLPLLIVFYLLVGEIPSTRLMVTGFIAGWLMLGAFQLYYKALNRADAALITTLFQLILPFNFIFGLWFFQESVSYLQILGLLIISISSLAISLEQKEKKWQLKSNVLLLMVSASLLASLSDVVFKLGGDSESFLQLSLAEYSSTVAAGIIILIASKKVRTELRGLGKHLRGTVSFLQMNELLNLFGTLSIRFAIISGPIALVQGVMGSQPFIVLIMSLVLGTLGVKSLRVKHLTKKSLAVELTAMLAVCAGAIMISGAIN